MMRIRSNLIRIDRKNRPEGKRIHHILLSETGNRYKCANALAYAAYLDSEAAELAGESWHYTVDDRQIIQHLPEGERCLLFQENQGEVIVKLCVNEGGDFQQTLWNAATLVRELLRVHHLGADAVLLKFEQNDSLLTQERWDCFFQQSCIAEGPRYSQSGEIYQIELIPERFGILIWEKEKNTTAVANYANCGFFFERTDGKLVPEGTLIVEGVVYANRARESDTIFWMDRAGRVGISRWAVVERMPQIRWAVSGIPVIEQGTQSTFSTSFCIKRWREFGLLPGWHGFLGTKEGRAYYFALPINGSGSEALHEILQKLAPYEMENVLKLDGGNSFVLDLAGRKIGSSSENQRVHNLLLF